MYDDFIDQVPSSETTAIKTRNGKTLEADLVIPAWGTRPNTDILASLGSPTLSPSGFVKVLPTFQLPEHPEIFAFGDIVDIKEQKQAAKADVHSGIVSGNVLAYLG